jgi:hypothetical protein
MGQKETLADRTPLPFQLSFGECWDIDLPSATLLADGILDTRGEARVGIGTAWNRAAV